MPDTDLLQRINAGREVYYNFLSRSYQKEVNGEYLEMVVSLLPHIENITSQTDIVSMNKGVELLREFVDELSELNEISTKGILLDLARDFAFLFLTGVSSVPTCESVYRSPDHLLKHGPFYSDVLKIYLENGFQVPTDIKEPKDHIAIQFKFLAVLSKKIDRAIEERDYECVSKTLDIQYKFIEEHLKKWIPQFCQLLLKVTKEKIFYKAIANLTDGFLEMDYGLIRNEISQLINYTQPDSSTQVGV